MDFAQLYIWKMVKISNYKQFNWSVQANMDRNITNNLIDQFKQISIETSSKGSNHKLFKEELKFENYLDILEDKDTFTLCRFRTANVTDYK